MRAALMMMTVAVMIPLAGGALAQTDASRNGTEVAQPKGQAGDSATHTGGERRVRVSASALSDIAASLRAPWVPPPADGTSRIYIPGRSPLYCFSMGGIATCQ